MNKDEQIEALQKIIAWISAGGQAGVFFDVTRDDEMVITLHLKARSRGNKIPEGQEDIK